LLLSVVIPCHNQADSLKETLSSLDKQSIPYDQYEVILIDDGSTDQTKGNADGFTSAYSFRYVYQEKSGASSARNRGAEEADAELVLFLDADMICDPGLLSTHLQAHQGTNRAIVEGSRKPWRKETSSLYYQVIDVDTNFLPHLQREKNFGDMLSCNMSLSCKLFREIGGFDPGLSRWEDIDFAFRAVALGAQLKFIPEAIAYHNHPMTFPEYCQKQLITHQLALDLFRKHPGILVHFDYLRDRFNIDWMKDGGKLILRKLIRQFMTWRPVFGFMEFSVEVLERYFPNRSILSHLYTWIIASYQVIGLRNGDGH